MRCCPNCGSTDVEEFLAGWFPANDPDGRGVDLALAELYSSLYWCNACSRHLPKLDEVKEQPKRKRRRKRL